MSFWYSTDEVLIKKNQEHDAKVLIILEDF